MSSRTTTNDFAPIQGHIDRFGLQHIADVAQGFANAMRAVTRATGRAAKAFAAAMARGYSAEQDNRAIEADAFLRRSAPRY